MKKVTKKSLMLLLKSVFVIALFSVIVFNMYSAKAEEKKYSTFDWDKFKEKNTENWQEYCENIYNDQGKEEIAKCFEDLSNSLEKFYKKLYKLLSIYQDAGYPINDQVILWTIFYGQYFSPTTGVTTYNVNDYNNSDNFHRQWSNKYFGYTSDDSDGSDESVDARYDEDYADFYE